MKKIMSFMLVSILLVSMLSACASNGGNNSSSGSKNSETSNGSSSSSSTETSSPATPKQVKFTVPVLPDDLETFNLVNEEFKKENSNIEVEFIAFPATQYYEKLRIQLSGGVEYDLFGGVLDKMIDTGIVEPLDDYIKANNTDVIGYGELLDNLKVNGSIYGLPYRKSNWMMFYNKDLFDAAGVAYPSEDITWTEFRELAKQLTSGSGPDKTYGAFLHHWAQTWYMQAVQSGASVIDKDLTPFIDAMQYRLDLEADGSIMPWTESKSTGTHYNAFFQSGKVAMSIIGDWHVAQLRQAEDEGKMSFNWDVTPVPHPDGVKANTSLGLPVSLMMNKNSKHKEEAYKVIEFFSGPVAAEIFASRGFITGYSNDDIVAAYFGDGSRNPANIHYFFETTEFAEYPMLPGVKTIVVDGIYVQEGELVFAGEQTPQEAVEKMKTRIESEWASIYEDQFKID